MFNKMLKAIIKIVLIITIYLGSCYIIYKQEKPNEPFHLPKFNVKEITHIKEKLEQEVQKEQEKDNSIGELRINSINLKEKLYPINDKKNNVDQNVTILKESIPPNKDNSIMFLAAHSGTGPYAYFKNLDKINKNDTIKLFYEHNEYNYVVKNIWETEKDGDIEITKEKENQLILTTCSPTNKKKQLIINCIKKES